MGGLFGGAQNVNTSAPIITSLRVQTSAYGRCIPLCYGKTRVAGNLIWYNDFTAIPHTTTQSSGGKGGGGGSMSQTDYTYTAAAIMGLCEGAVVSVPTVWADKEQTTTTALSMSVYLGSTSQTALPYVTTNHPSEALGYRQLAYVAAGSYDLGNNASLPNHTFEVEALLPFSGSIRDANPKDVLADYLTHASHGAGFPSAQLASWSSWSDYCVATGVFISPAYTEQAPAADTVAALARIGNAAPVFSEGVLKVIPYGDQAVTGNGVTFTPNTTPVYALTDDDFLDNGDTDPVIVSRSDPADAYNQVQVKFFNRANQYNEDVATAFDQASIELYGLRPMEPVVAHEICDAAVAQIVAQILLQRAQGVRNTYRFPVGWRYVLLEPMDLLTLTEGDSNGLNGVPVRITEIEENEDGELSITAEDAPAGVGTAAQYPVQANGGYAANYNASPGEVVAPLIFEAPVEKTSETGLGIYVAVTGQTSMWGGCNVWVSLDGATYKQMATIHGGARYGHLTASMSAQPAGSDVVNTVAVTLSGTGGQMLSGTSNDAQLLNTLIYVDGEYLSYVTATLTGQNAYSLTNLIRGAYTTASPSHSSNASFARVDEALAMMEIDPTYIGKQIWFKFTSFNIFQGGETDLAAATAYPYTVTGAMIKLPPPQLDSFLIAVQADGTRQYSWAYNAGAPTDVTNGGGYRIKYYLGSTSDWSVMTDMHPTGLLTHSPFENNLLAAGTYTFAIKAVDKLGNESTAAKFITATVADPRLGNVLVQRMERGLGWPGTITGGFVYNGSILAKSSSTIASLPAAISSLSGQIDTIGTNTSPITYVTPVIDLGVNTSFNPLITPTVQGTPTITMKTGTTADGGVVGSWVALSNVTGKRYVQFQISVADTAPRIDELVTLLDGDVQEDDFNDVNTATETATWFYRIAAGHFRIGSKSGKIAGISTANIVALQNTGGAWTWELVNKTSTVNSQPAAEFKIRNAAGTLADAVIDVMLKGPRI